MLGRFCVDVVQHIFGGICGEFLTLRTHESIESDSEVFSKTWNKNTFIYFQAVIIGLQKEE